MRLYVLKDSVLGTGSIILTSPKDTVLKRDLKGFLLSKQQNIFNTDTKDKDVYYVGDLNQDTCAVTPVTPVFVYNLEALRVELIQEIQFEQASISAKKESEEVVTNE